MQYADRPTASSPIVEIGYEDDGILHKFGFNFREDEEINLSDLFRGIETAKRGIQDAIEGASDLSAFDFQREIELVKKLSAFANQSKMDNNNVVMLKSNMNHPNQEWNDKEEKGMNDMWDLQNSQEDFDSYKYQGLSEELDNNDEGEDIQLYPFSSEFVDIINGVAKTKNDLKYSAGATFGGASENYYSRLSIALNDFYKNIYKPIEAKYIEEMAQEDKSRRRLYPQNYENK